nr:hypothetical protein [Odoribacter sp.]
MKVPLRYYWLVGCLILGAFSVNAGEKDAQKGQTAETPCLTEEKKGRDNQHNVVILKELPELWVSGKEGDRQGVSAPYAGMSGDRLVVAGGCNFPGVPAAEGGEKVYY